MTTNKRLPRPRDPIQLGKLIGDILTGQVEDRAPDVSTDPNKDPAAVALGRKGGLKGARARRLVDANGTQKNCEGRSCEVMGAHKTLDAH